MTEQLTFPITTYKNVFDVMPHPEQITLDELTDGLTRFQVKPQVQKRIDREIRRIATVHKSWAAGETMTGKRGKKIRDAATRAEKAGERVEDAVAAAIEQMCVDARRNSKKELRLWSPTRFSSGGRRDSDHATHLSCLVLDYDDGTSIEDAVRVWKGWYFVLHTTWSHTPDKPRFRVVLPLTAPVPAHLWPEVWFWAERLTGQSIDPTCKGVARTYALPVTPSPGALRVAFTNRGPLLSPVAEGIVGELGPLPDAVPSVPHDDGFTWSTGDPDDRYVVQNDPPEAWGADTSAPLIVWDDSDPELLDDDDVWDGGAPDIPLHVPAREPGLAGPVAEPHSPAPSADALGASSQALARIAALLERLLDQTARGSRAGLDVGDLERLAALHDAGALTAEEFALAKRRLLDGDTG